jgi:hypothetical protein
MMMETRRKKARYTKIKINEISCVDKPAQEGAVMVIMKRHDPNGDDFLALVDRIKDRDKSSRLQALRTARLEHSHAFEAFQDAATEAETEMDSETEKSRRGLTRNSNQRAASRQQQAVLQERLAEAERLNSELTTALRDKKRDPVEVRQLAEKVVIAKRAAHIW